MPFVILIALDYFGNPRQILSTGRGSDWLISLLSSAAVLDRGPSSGLSYSGQRRSSSCFDNVVLSVDVINGMVADLARFERLSGQGVLDAIAVLALTLALLSISGLMSLL